MTFSALDPDIDRARRTYVQLRGYLRGEQELAALDGVFNAVKAPQRLRLDEPDASIDQKLESLEHMVVSLHRIGDLLTSLRGRYMKRTKVGSRSVDAELRGLREDPSFEYFEHFTNGVKHSIYVHRGSSGGALYFDAFTYRDHGRTIAEPRVPAEEIVDDARKLIVIATRVMYAMAYALDGVAEFDPSAAQVCATPTYDPSLYAAADGEGSDGGSV